jgi:hypothetical protein
MEGYFVRTLGMHRVYNSAFMNMLRDEKNLEYRQVIKNTIEFDPEILKRYVNFMNNPDERTAVDQFGKGDKYFGICILMSTLPGLPMFGHGQVEGYTEKYGMEYHRAYWDERPDGYLMERHARQVFPLLRKRYLFAEARDFLLYDVIAGPGNAISEGSVLEDVYAYTNRAGSERALAVYHNKFAHANGQIKLSTAYPVKTGETDESGAPARVLLRKSLAEGLGLRDDPSVYTIFRDEITGLEYLHNNHALHQQGLQVSLEAYEAHVFLDFREVQEDAWHPYGQLAAYLAGRGVPSVEDALKEIFLQAVHYPLGEIMNPGFLGWFTEHRASSRDDHARETDRESVLAEFDRKLSNLLRGIEALIQQPGRAALVQQQLNAEARALLYLPALDAALAQTGKPRTTAQARRRASLLKYLRKTGLLNGDIAIWHNLISWLALHQLGALADEAQAAEISRSWIDEWLLGKIAAQAGQELGLSSEAAWRSLNLVRLLISHAAWFDPAVPMKQRAQTALRSWLNDQAVQQFLGVNRYQGVLWFNKEAMENWLWWVFVLQVIRTTSQPAPAAGVELELQARYRVIQELQRAVKKSAYQVDKLLELF